MTTKALITQETIRENLGIVRFIDKDVTPQGLAMLAQAAVAYQLDPVLGEITMYEGKPYITGDGWHRKISASPVYDGEKTRVVPHQEASGMGLVCCQEAIVVGVMTFRKGIGHPDEFFGRACPRHPYRSNPVEVKFPYDMARKRAQIKGYRTTMRDQLPRAFLDMPTIEEAAFEGTAVVVNDEPVNPQTGEFLAPQATPVVDGQYTTAPTPTAAPAVTYSQSGAPTLCPDHGVEWFKRGAMRMFGHPTGDKKIAQSGPNKGKEVDVWCQRSAVLARIGAETREAAGVTQEEGAAWVRETFGVAPAELTDDNRQLVIDHWRGVLDSQAAPEPEAPTFEDAMDEAYADEPQQAAF